MLTTGSNSDLDNMASDKKKDEIPIQSTSNVIPIVGLLVQGSPKVIDHVHFYVQNKMPVVVLKGSGGLADMISYVSDEIHEK